MYLNRQLVCQFLSASFYHIVLYYYDYYYAVMLLMWKCNYSVVLWNEARMLKILLWLLLQLLLVLLLCHSVRCGSAVIPWCYGTRPTCECICGSTLSLRSSTRPTRCSWCPAFILVITQRWVKLPSSAYAVSHVTTRGLMWEWYVCRTTGMVAFPLPLPPVSLSYLSASLFLHPLPFLFSPLLSIFFVSSFPYFFFSLFLSLRSKIPKIQLEGLEEHCELPQ